MNQFFACSPDAGLVALLILTWFMLGFLAFFVGFLRGRLKTGRKRLAGLSLFLWLLFAAAGIYFFSLLMHVSGSGVLVGEKLIIRSGSTVNRTLDFKELAGDGPVNLKSAQYSDKSVRFRGTSIGSFRAGVMNFTNGTSNTIVAANPDAVALYLTNGEVMIIGISDKDRFLKAIWARSAKIQTRPLSVMP